MAFYELVYGILFEPAATFRRVSDENRLASTVVVVIGLSLFGFIVDWGTATGTNGLIWVGLMTLLFSLLWWLLVSAVYSLLGYLMLKRNNPAGIMNVFGLSLLPGLILIPLETVGNSLGIPGISAAASLAALAWISILQIIGLREVLNIDIGEALAIWVTPFGVTFVIIIVTIALFAGLLSQLFG